MFAFTVDRLALSPSDHHYSPDQSPDLGQVHRPFLDLRHLLPDLGLGNRLKLLVPAPDEAPPPLIYSHRHPSRILHSREIRSGKFL